MDSVKHLFVLCIGLLLLSGYGSHINNTHLQKIPAIQSQKGGSDLHATHPLAELTALDLENETEYELIFSEENDDETNSFQFAAAYAIYTRSAYHNINTILLQFGHALFAVNTEWHIFLCLFRI